MAHYTINLTKTQGKAGKEAEERNTIMNNLQHWVCSRAKSGGEAEPE